MPSKVIVMGKDFNLNVLTQDHPSNTPASWKWITKDRPERVDEHNYFRQQVRHIDVMASIRVFCILATDANMTVTHWAERAYRVERADEKAQVVELAPAMPWREFGVATRQAAPVAEEPKRVRA